MSKLVKASIIRYFNVNYMYIGKNKLSPKIIEKLPAKAVIIDNDKRILEDRLEKIDIVPI